MSGEVEQFLIYIADRIAVTVVDLIGQGQEVTLYGPSQLIQLQFLSEQRKLLIQGIDQSFLYEDIILTQEEGKVLLNMSYLLTVSEEIYLRKEYCLVLICI